jgi:hypothetical protein
MKRRRIRDFANGFSLLVGFNLPHVRLRQKGAGDEVRLKTEA